MRVHVGKEAILAGGRDIPRGARCLLQEGDPHDRLDALEAVLPRHDQPQRRAVLVGQDLPVQADDHEGEGVHGLIHSQCLDVRPLQDRDALAGHLFRVEERGEADEPGLAGGLEAGEQVRERETHPRHDQRPSLHAPEPIDALLERVRLQDVLEREGPLDLGFAVHRHVPGGGAEFAGIGRRLILVRSELVEVVVGGDLRVLVRGLGHRPLRVALE